MTSGSLFVMLDLDGTLVDTSDLYLTGVPQTVKRHLGQDIAIATYMDLWGHDVRRWFARAADGNHSAAEAMYEDFEAFYIANHGRCTAYPGVAEGLAHLKNLGHTIGVVTTRPQQRADLVSDFSWSAALDFVVGGDRVARRKPFPDSLDLAIELHGRAQSFGARVYVGDNALDIEAALASRHSILGVAAVWGARDRDGLIAARPHRAFDSFIDCAHWLAAGPHGFSTVARGAALPPRAMTL